MKKNIIILIATIGAGIILCNAGSCSIISTTDAATIQYDEWTGYIRIEGETETIWKGTISVDNSEIIAENMDTHEMETHEINYPSVLGALDEASKEGDFSYTVVYYPSWDSLFVTSIKGDSTGEKTGWLYWVDYEAIMVGADQYELTADNSEILWGYLYFETWETNAHALKINIDKDVVKKGEEFTIAVTDETDAAIEGAAIHINTQTYYTDSNGQVTTSIDTQGSYKIFAEKEHSDEDTYLRSDVVSITVKKSRNRFINLFSYMSMLKNLLSKNILDQLYV